MAAGGPARAGRSRLHQPGAALQYSGVSLRIYKLEAAGSLIIGALILLLTLTRYWHHIVWGAR